MSTAIQHRPMSEILVPEAEVGAEKVETPAVEPEPKPVEESTLPEKYKGKTVEEVIDMHQNAEQELGRVRNEVGGLRGQVTDLTALVRTGPAAEEVKQEDVTLTGDQVITDPVGAIREVIQHDRAIEDAKKETSDLDATLSGELKALEDDFGNYDALVQSQPFLDFASRTPSRKQDFQNAAYAKGLTQVRAARRLLEDYTDFTHTTESEETLPKTPVEEAKAVITEAGNSSAPISSKEMLYESDAIEMCRNDPSKYRSPSYQKMLADAINEGRFVKNT